jgi:hypothetical protein
MHRYDSYYRGLVVASVLRFGLFTGLMAILAIMSGCSVPWSNPRNILPSMSADADVNRREGDQTRNHVPPCGGNDEKSDRSLRKPLT